MKVLELDQLEEWYSENFQSKLSGRRILFDDISPLITDLNKEFQRNILGYSVNQIPIYKISIGNGSKKIMIWSQMHGNESTGTKALFDVFNFLSYPKELSPIADNILENCSLIFIPILNPDGSINFTRENADGIDLNRDAVDLKAVESSILRTILDEFEPHFCFNLHDQRSIFNVENTQNPAILSFLAPSVEETRKVTRGRKETMSVIVSMNKLLQQVIPNSIGRYTDEYYPKATGDNFQKLGYNTILIEAGHFQNDYDREVTRKFNFYALLQGIYTVATEEKQDNWKPYFDIPNNDKKYFDVIYRNAKVIEDDKELIVDVGILFKYKVVESKLSQYEYVEKKGDLSSYFGHKEIDLSNKTFS